MHLNSFTCSIILSENGINTTESKDEVAYTEEGANSVLCDVGYQVNGLDVEDNQQKIKMTTSHILITFNNFFAGISTQQKTHQ